MCHLFGGLARLGSTGSFQRSPEPQLLLWPKAASAAVNALRRNRSNLRDSERSPHHVGNTWCAGETRTPAVRFLGPSSFAARQNHRALNRLQCPDDGNARRQKIWKNSRQSSICGRVCGGAEQTENSSSSMPFFLLVCHSKQQSVGMNEIWHWSLKAPDLLNQR